MPALDELLERPGLAPGPRLWILAAVAVWPGDWERLEAVLAAARARGMERRGFEEVLLQAALFCGFPRVVSAFGELDRCWPAPPPTASPPAGAGEMAAAGRAFFAGVYGEGAPKVEAMLARHHPDLRDFVLDAAYGRVLSRPGLPPATRELIAVALLAVQDQRPQLVGHGRGALRLGATPAEVGEALFTALGDGQEVRGLLRRIRG